MTKRVLSPRDWKEINRAHRAHVRQVLREQLAFFRLIDQEFQRGEKKPRVFSNKITQK